MESPLVTIGGDSINDIRDLLVGRESYSARDVIAHLGAGVDVTSASDVSITR
jgi:hypothetical protein